MDPNSSDHFHYVDLECLLHKQSAPHANNLDEDEVDSTGPDLNAAAQHLPQGSDKTTEALDATLQKLPPR